MRFTFSFVFALLLGAAPLSATAQSAVDCPNTVRVANGCDDYVYEEPERGPGYGESIYRGGGLTVLYAPANPDDPAFRAAIAGFLGGTVDYWDAVASTPTVGDLAAYDAVITWANQSYSDNVAMGDNLAAYVDGGGIVKLSCFTTYTTGNFLSGAIMTAGYSPVVSPGGDNHFSTDIWAGDGVLPVYTGVAGLECFVRDFLVTQGAGLDDSHYLDQELLVTSRTDGVKVHHINGIGDIALGCTGDWAQLFANLIDFKIPVELEVAVETPDRYVLLPAYPNPFNPEATVRFAVRNSAPVTLTLHDALGRQVSTLYSGTPETNQTHSVQIDGSGLPSGLYLVRLSGQGFTASQPVTLLK